LESPLLVTLLTSDCERRVLGIERKREHVGRTKLQTQTTGLKEMKDSYKTLSRVSGILLDALPRCGTRHNRLCPWSPQSGKQWT